MDKEEIKSKIKDLEEKNLKLTKSIKKIECMDIEERFENDRLKNNKNDEMLNIKCDNIKMKTSILFKIIKSLLDDSEKANDFKNELEQFININ